jgi:hypothetical protein
VAFVVSNASLSVWKGSKTKQISLLRYCQAAFHANLAKVSLQVKLQLVYTRRRLNQPKHRIQIVKMVRGVVR